MSADDTKDFNSTSSFSAHGIRVSEIYCEIDKDLATISIHLRGTLGHVETGVIASSKTQDSNLVAEKTKSITLPTVLQLYLDQRTELRPSTRRAYNTIVNQRLPDWFDIPMVAITKSMVEERHRFISTVGGAWKSSKVQANMAMRVLKLLFNFAIRQYETKNGCPLISSNPVSTLTQNKHWHRIAGRQGIVPDQKLARWYEALSKLSSTTARDYLLFVLLTGLRRKEAASLTWGDIDFQTKILRIDSSRTKNHKTHQLPLTPFLCELLKRRYIAKKSIYVFPGRVGALTHCTEILTRVRAQCDCYFTIHDLRRTFLSMAERLDVPHYALKKLANHSGGGDTTFGYLIVETERLRRPMEKITNQFVKLMKVTETTTP